MNFPVGDAILNFIMIYITLQTQYQMNWRAWFVLKHHNKGESDRYQITIANALQMQFSPGAFSFFIIP